MQQFTNLVRSDKPEGILFPQETDLLLELIQGVLESVAPQATKGTFILDGQKYGEEAQCILRFNLSEGNFRRNFFRSYDKTSDQMAEESIDEMLAIPGQSRYIDGGRPLQYQITNDDRSMTNGVHRDGELMVLVLNATHGRFLMTCHLDEKNDGDSDVTAAELVLYAVAQAIAMMGKEDISLQYSARFISDFAMRAIDGYVGIWQHVESAFQAGDGPAMAAWKAWHEPANTKGELDLFFE